MLFLRNIRQDPQTGNYVAIEAASKYIIPPTLYPDLYEFIKLKPTALVGEWYRLLPDKEKNEVKKFPLFG